MNGEDNYLLLKNGHIIDPANNFNHPGEILIHKNKIIWIAPINHKNEIPKQLSVFDAQGLIVCPGFIDLHCHLREPGFEEKETLQSGSMAAAKGGFTTICAMPNTSPPLDTPELIEFVLRKTKELNLIRVLPIGCVTKHRSGKELVDMEALAEAGVIGFSDDGDPVSDPELMRKALEISARLELPIIQHCQDLQLSKGAILHQGWVAKQLGVVGMPSEAEEKMAARDIQLASQTGGILHLAHISTEGTLALTKEAKSMDINVTAEVTPHHLSLTEDWAITESYNNSESVYDTRAKVNPPLRTPIDVSALIEGLREGTIDAIATDHAPHRSEDKNCTMEEAAFGISGLETTLGLLMRIVNRGELDLPTLIERLTVGPAMILPKSWRKLGSLSVGNLADITIFDPNHEWVVRPEDMLTKGKNTPLIGSTLTGKVQVTISNGKIVYQDNASYNRLSLEEN